MDIERWVLQDMCTRYQPPESEIDTLSETVADKMRRENKTLYFKLDRFQAKHNLTPAVYVASVMYFASKGDWKSRNKCCLSPHDQLH